MTIEQKEKWELFLCVNVHGSAVHEWVYTRAVEARGRPQMSSLRSCPSSFLRQCLSLAWNSLPSLGCMSSKPQLCVYFCFLCAGTTRASHHTGLSYMTSEAQIRLLQEGPSQIRRLPGPTIYSMHFSCFAFPLRCFVCVLKLWLVVNED